MNKYLQLGYYTNSLPESFYRKIKRKVGNKKGEKIVISVIKALFSEFDPKKSYLTQTRNLKLSRFITVNKIIKIKLFTCGSASAVLASILRKLGYPTKLIDGKIKSKSKWRRHAWIEVYLKERERFIPLDPFSNQYKITKKHRRLGAYVDWRELEKKAK
jgi:hypothetical protein